MNHPEHFHQHGYAFVKDLIPQDICKIATKYALIQETVNFREEGEYAQVPESHAMYSDILMETLLFFMLGHMEKLTGLELFPTYSYYRVYRPGMELERHKDRPACEISTTACLGYQYNDVDESYSWGMFVDEKSRGIAKEDGIYFVSAGNPGIMLPQKPGDLIVYRGYDIEHWREPFAAGPGSYQVQAFFHYIDKNGPYYPEHCYDTRPGLGYSVDFKKENVRIQTNTQNG